MIYKPDSSRPTSVEAFIVCQNFQPPKLIDLSKFTLTTYQTEKKKAKYYQYKVENNKVEEEKEGFEPKYNEEVDVKETCTKN